jgi:integrase/recombinase XerD
VTAKNLPALVQQPEDHAAKLAVAFARAAKTSHTSDARRRDLLGYSRSPGWLPWCTKQGIDPLGLVRPAHVLAWVADLAAAGDAESSRNRRLSTVSAWYKYLVREETVPGNPVDRIDPGEKPKSAKKIYRTSPTHAPSREQVERLQRVADEDGPLASAFVALLAGTGARVSELANANVADIYQDGGHIMMSIAGKGGIVTHSPIPPAVWERVWRLVQDRTADADRLPALAADGPGRARPLLPGKNGQHVRRQTLARLLTRLLKKAGIGEGRYTPHSFRNAYISDGIYDGIPARDLQRAVGHLSLETTIRYDKSHLSPERHPNYRRAAQLAEVRDRRRANEGDCTDLR